MPTKRAARTTPASRVLVCVVLRTAVHKPGLDKSSWGMWPTRTSVRARVERQRHAATQRQQ
eukprot:2888019-Alexandrium_andersonii.AAC.1